MIVQLFNFEQVIPPGLDNGYEFDGPFQNRRARLNGREIEPVFSLVLIHNYIDKN